MLVFLLPHFPDSSAVLSLLLNGNLLTDLELALLSSPFHLPTPIGAFWCHLSNKLLSFKFYSRGLLLGQTQSKTPVYSFPCHWTSGFQFFTLTKLQHISTNLSFCLSRSIYGGFLLVFICEWNCWIKWYVRLQP